MQLRGGPVLNHQRNAVFCVFKQAEPPASCPITQTRIEMQADFSWFVEHEREFVQRQSQPHSARFDVGLFQGP